VIDEPFSVRESLPPQVEEVVAVLQDPFQQIEFLRELLPAKPWEPVLIDAAVAERMVQPFSWLLDHVGESGIRLTQAGYLPPASVEQLAGVLHLEDEWIGKLNREVQTYPVLEFRESVMRAGLLRKSKGSLLLTRAGRELRDEPVKLWWHLAGNVPPKRSSHVQHQATILVLAAVASQLDEGPLEFAARMMPRLGYGMPDGSSISRWTVRDTIEDGWTILRTSGSVAVAPVLSQGRDRSTVEGALFARAALRTWPAAE
jgi:hypothetical protein